MKEILAATSGIPLLFAGVAFIFAVVMQPIFIWMICHRVKKSNEHLRSIDAHLATLAGNKTRPIVRTYSGPPGKIMAEH